MKLTVSNLLEGGPPPSADEVAAIIVALAMQRTAVSDPTAPPAGRSRFRLDGRTYEPYDRELP